MEQSIKVMKQRQESVITEMVEHIHNGAKFAAEVCLEIALDYTMKIVEAKEKSQ